MAVPEDITDEARSIVELIISHLPQDIDILTEEVVAYAHTMDRRTVQDNGSAFRDNNRRYQFYQFVAARAGVVRPYSRLFPDGFCKGVKCVVDVHFSKLVIVCGCLLCRQAKASVWTSATTITTS